MARTQTMVQLTDELVDLLDREATRRGASRSAVIREILESALAQQREAELGRRIAEGYRRIPVATPDEWGSLDAATDQSARELLVRLDREEADAGLEPW